MIPVPICGRADWTVLMPEWRAAREQNPWWEWPRYASMFHNLRPGDVLYDVGSESGDQSALYARFIHPGPIVLIEPNPLSWPAIRAIWEANHLPEPAACFVGFLASTNTTNEDTFGWPACSIGELEPENGWCNLAYDTDVPRRTLDDWLPAVPDALTIDVEGAELHVLQGAELTLAEHKPLVWVSIHPTFLRDFYGQTRADVVGFMDGLGYRCEHLADEHEMHTLFWHPEGRTPVLPYGSP